MGADIHAYVEYYSKSELRQKSSCFVDCFSERIQFGRNYSLFGLLAGVRGLNSPVVFPKGLPKTPELSFVCENDFYLTVKENGDNRNNISHEEAERYIKSGASYYKNNKIKNPGWHSETWLTLSELSIVRKLYLLDHIQYQSESSGKDKKNLLKFIDSIPENELIKYCFPPHEDIILYSTINIMTCLEKASEDNDIETRFVCWFDS